MSREASTLHVLKARLAGLHGYRWEKAVGVRVDLTPGRETVILDIDIDIDTEPTLTWSGPGVAPMAVAAVFHLYGPIAMIEHRGLAPLRVPIDVTAARPEPSGLASIEPPRSPDH